MALALGHLVRFTIAPTHDSLSNLRHKVNLGCLLARHGLKAGWILALRPMRFTVSVNSYRPISEDGLTDHPS